MQIAQRNGLKPGAIVPWKAIVKSGACGVCMLAYGLGWSAPQFQFPGGIYKHQTVPENQ